MHALPEDSEQPIEIRADQARSEPDGTSVLTGDVRIDQGTLSLAADRVTVATREKRLHKIVAEGDGDTPVRFRQQIRTDEPFANGHANHIDYAVTEQRLALKGDAFLSVGDREFEGDLITWDIEDGRVDARSNMPRRTKLKWQPKPKPED
ncbi:MAG: lipopolysaccharide transport periplasmic protein LptA [Gammaproteobacteria bacterium]|nr:lipopolysaccharide transport periplasmic protein LptA [Gammaproteobacteria bacterium]